jgi:sugar phosphate isomerase/epimerase
VQLDHAGLLDLTYCTNIHPGDGWRAVDANIRRYAPALKARLSPSAPFALGLRLSARDARELLEGSHLDVFHEYLAREGLYVPLINGFPYGPFHGTPVKAEVYAPDWQDDARAAYTEDLVRILARLLPAGADGGVSTAPLTYKRWLKGAGPDAMEVMTRQVVRVAAALVRARQESGVFIHLDIEPEPDCALETSAEMIEFFDRWLLPSGAPALAEALGITREEARQALVDHVQVCFDCCHFSVEYEEPLEAIDRLRKAGLRIGRVQLSSAIEVPLPEGRHAAEAVAERLRPFADSTYLHQVIERHGTTLRHYPDLPDALETAAHAAGREWRIHFHVPLFTSEYDGFGSTQRDVQRVIENAARAPFTKHLEIETYTWDVLPGDMKIDLLESIHREYEWVLERYRAAADAN